MESCLEGDMEGIDVMWKKHFDRLCEVIKYLCSYRNGLTRSWYGNIKINVIVIYHMTKTTTMVNMDITSSQ